jgi:bacteriocin-like protein
MKNLTSDELDQVSGGIFAYDVGRVLRFIYLAGPTGSTMAIAVGDWIAVASQP